MKDNLFKKNKKKKKIEFYLNKKNNKNLLRFLTCGSVDDGKSTLIGRLLYDTKQIYEDQLITLKKESSKIGRVGNINKKLDLSLLVDGLQSEREQGITIDVAYRYFNTKKRKFIIVDTPGHKQYTRNMVTGASTCDLSIILIDARKGVLKQTKRHSFISKLLGIKHFIVAINKMDLINYNIKKFKIICKEYLNFFKKLSSDLNIFFIPISALKGENVVYKSLLMPWYKGQTLIEILESIKLNSNNKKKKCRFPIQYVNRPNLNFRGYSGTLSSGSLKVGQKIKLLPSNLESYITNIITYDGNKKKTFCGEAVTLVLKDDLDISRGDILIDFKDKIKITKFAYIYIVWMSKILLKKNKKFFVKIANKITNIKIDKIKYKFNINNFKKKKTKNLSINDIGLVKISFEENMVLDKYYDNFTTGGMIFIDKLNNDTIGAGMVKKIINNNNINKFLFHNKFELDLNKFILKYFPHWKIKKIFNKKLNSFKKKNLFWHKNFVKRKDREKLHNNSGLILWFTGLSGSGKSTLANFLELKLNKKKFSTYLIDGDNIRQGLCNDLGFDKLSRHENIRRIIELSKMMFDAGLIVLVACVSPYIKDRKKARNMFPKNKFIEIFVDTPIKICKHRDVKGLYKKAHLGKISKFTGISDTYELPISPEIHLNGKKNIKDLIKLIISFFKKKKIINI